MLLCGCGAGHGLKNAPTNYAVTYPFEFRGPFLSSDDTAEIVQFVQTIPGIDHHVVRISVESRGHVEVQTGGGKQAGNVVHLRREEGKWVVEERVKVEG